MRIGLYNWPSGGGLGGSEFLIATLAHKLARHHSVEILHHHAGLEIEHLERFTGIPMSSVSLKRVGSSLFQPSASSKPWTIRKEHREWNAELSRGYDRFVASTHWIPPFNHAELGILIVLFPFFSPAASWPWTDSPRSRLDVKRSVRNAFYAAEWRQRLKSYSHVVSISKYVRRWTKVLWSTDSQVIYPPVPVKSARDRKTNTVLSVGRFSTQGHPKKHEEMLTALSDLLPNAGWTYVCAGSLGESAEDRAYFQKLSRLAAETKASLRPNVPRSELCRQYAQAKLFVHATGYNELESSPEAAEHFGIATVEAMAAGCVPVVVNRGAQPEIVQHGESGFVWSSVDELRQYVSALMSDDAMLARMSEAARARAQTFGAEQFTSKMLELMELRCA